MVKSIPSISVTRVRIADLRSVLRLQPRGSIWQTRGALARRRQRRQKGSGDREAGESANVPGPGEELSRSRRTAYAVRRVQIRTFQSDSQFGCWMQSEWRPAHLARLVERFWYSEGTLVSARERVFPNGHAELVVHLGEVFS